MSLILSPILTDVIANCEGRTGLLDDVEEETREEDMLPVGCSEAQSEGQ